MWHLTGGERGFSEKLSHLAAARWRAIPPFGSFVKFARRNAHTTICAAGVRGARITPPEGV